MLRWQPFPRINYLAYPSREGASYVCHTSELSHMLNLNPALPSSRRASPMTPQTGIPARILPSLLTSIQPTSTRRGAKNNVASLTENGMVRYMLILFVASHISHCSAWSWTTHQTPPDPESQIGEDVLPNIFDGDIDFIISRLEAKTMTGAELSQAGRDALFTNKGISKRRSDQVSHIVQRCSPVLRTEAGLLPGCHSLGKSPL